MDAVDRIGSAFLRMILLRMKELGLNKSALARRMNVSRAYVSKVLSGDVNISFGTAIRFAHALQMDFTPMLTPRLDDDPQERVRPTRSISFGQRALAAS